MQGERARAGSMTSQVIFVGVREIGALVPGLGHISLSSGLGINAQNGMTKCTRTGTH